MNLFQRQFPVSLSDSAEVERAPKNEMQIILGVNELRSESGFKSSKVEPSNKKRTVSHQNSQKDGQ